MRTALGAALVALAVGACAGDDLPGGTDSTDAGSDATVSTDPASTTGTTVGTTAAATAATVSTSAPSSTIDTVDTGQQPEGVTTVTLEVSGADACCVWLADAPDERSRGLMRVTDLGEPVGMLFAYPDEQTANFFMFNTRLPLSIAFFDGDGRFVSSTDMEPCRSRDPAECPRYQAEEPYRYALEVRQGELGALGIRPGTIITPGAEAEGCADSS